MIKLEKPNDIFKQRAKELRKNSTLSEVLLWIQLKNKQFMGLDFDRQKIINNKYIADFYCPQYDLIIEIDGCSHEGKVKYDLDRHNYLVELGFNIIHIIDLDVKNNLEGVLGDLKNIIITTTPSLRDTPSPAKGI